MTIANYFHSNQFDKGGYPYMHHILHIAEQFNTTDEVVVALLHDSIEDYGEIAYEMIIRAGFNNNIMTALDAITRRNNEQYNSYIDRLSKNRIATSVKVEDLRHNMNKTRCQITDSLHRRYSKAFKKLVDMEANRYGT